MRVCACMEVWNKMFSTAAAAMSMVMLDVGASVQGSVQCILLQTTVDKGSSFNANGSV